MYGQNKAFILLLCAASSAVLGLKVKNCTVSNNASISSPLVEPCPANSQCMLVNSTFKCICLPNFQQNAIPISLPDLEHAFIPYCLLKNVSDELTTQSAEEQSKMMFYIRSPAEMENLVFAILLVLLGVISVVAIVYLIKLLRPLKRTKVAYVRLKRRNNKHQRLVEEEVYDGIAMTRRDENAQYY
ncbi:PREDICTED: uncharacterized protein LOC108353964 [Rhagoletis zephyria]|uniref:uncharacterized protein LOC108353964 n=1 Tax=Rhagoletis zephyria TaxID=28612 RepID=UPI00081194AF|nr:PREDICTED: uncharacterized protein LOC108353964 [Rhagoletis zephyria]